MKLFLKDLHLWTRQVVFIFNYIKIRPFNYNFVVKSENQQKYTYHSFLLQSSDINIILLRSKHPSPSYVITDGTKRTKKILFNFLKSHKLIVSATKMVNENRELPSNPKLPQASIEYKSRSRYAQIIHRLPRKKEKERKRKTKKEGRPPFFTRRFMRQNKERMEEKRGRARSRGRKRVHALVPRGISIFATRKRN